MKTRYIVLYNRYFKIVIFPSRWVKIRKFQIKFLEFPEEHGVVLKKTCKTFRTNFPLTVISFGNFWNYIAFN